MNNVYLPPDEIFTLHITFPQKHFGGSNSGSYYMFMPVGSESGSWAAKRKGHKSPTAHCR
jgi:hypothetical protein